MIPITIIAIGSSSLFGVGDPIGGGYIGRFKTWHEKQNIRNRVFNLGISGETTRDFLKRFYQEIKVRQPDLIIIGTGSNDTRRVGTKHSSPLVSLELFRKNVTELIKIGKSLTDVMVISVNAINDKKTAPLTFWHKDNFYLLDDSKKYRAAEKEVCTKLHVPYLDIFNEWLQKGYEDLLHEDGLHPNPKGHQQIFLTLKKFIIDLYR